MLQAPKVAFYLCLWSLKPAFSLYERFGYLGSHNCEILSPDFHAGHYVDHIHAVEDQLSSFVIHLHHVLSLLALLWRLQAELLFPGFGSGREL